jgi:hypothetical protein
LYVIRALICVGSPVELGRRGTYAWRAVRRPLRSTRRILARVRHAAHPARWHLWHVPSHDYGVQADRASSIPYGFDLPIVVRPKYTRLRAGRDASVAHLLREISCRTQRISLAPLRQASLSYIRRGSFPSVLTAKQLTPHWSSVTSNPLEHEDCVAPHPLCVAYG